VAALERAVELDGANSRYREVLRQALDESKTAGVAPGAGNSSEAGTSG
jgi:hypothetical protein